MTKRAIQGNSFGQQKLAKTGARRKSLEDQRSKFEPGAEGSRNDLLPDLQVRMMPIASLQPSRHRTRRTNPEQLARVIAAIADTGFNQPVLIHGNEIIDGHTRIEAATNLGLGEVPAIDIGHLSEVQIRKLRLALNRIGELGEWDLSLLRIEIQDLTDLEIDLSSTGFSCEELDIIRLDDIEAETDEDEVEEPADTAISRTGDIWDLDHHRVICGNALDAANYETLLEGKQIHAVISDFPYNVKIAGNVSGLGKVKHGEFAMASGEMTRDQFRDFLTAAINGFKPHLLAGSAVFGFMDWRSIHLLYAAGSAAGLELLNLVVWYKQSGGMGGNYRSAHELIAVHCNGEALRTNNIQLGRHGRDRTNVWSLPGANRRGSSANSMLRHHATPKPVELCVDAILDVTHRGEHVLDPFLGSGTSLIAAEKTGRRCYGIELEPAFVDVAIRRWQELSGRSPILAETGETLELVTERRLAEAGATARPANDSQEGQ